jgi:hypothetical protein
MVVDDEPPVHEILLTAFVASVAELPTQIPPRVEVPVAVISTLHKPLMITFPSPVFTPATFTWLFPVL